MTIRSFSYGGGVQSTAALVLASQGKIDYKLFLFSNVGDDSEHPATLEYLDKWAKPFAEAHGIELHELKRTKRDGTVETLHGRLVKEGSRSLPIPVRMSNGAPGSRSCTADFKIRVIAKWLREHGATEEDPAVVGIGISTDEIGRMNNRRLEKCEVTEYPLITLGLSRADCAEIIRQAGMPVPHKSSCYFCPFHTIGTWAEMRRDEPELFAKTVALETLLNDRRAALPCPGVGEFPAEWWQMTVECATHGVDCDTTGVDCEEIEVRIFGGRPTVDRGMTCPSCKAVVTIDADERMEFHGKDPVYFNSRAVPLLQIGEAQTPLFADDAETCDAFSCFT